MLEKKGRSEEQRWANEQDQRGPGKVEIKNG